MGRKTRMAREKMEDFTRQLPILSSQHLKGNVWVTQLTTLLDILGAVLQGCIYVQNIVHKENSL